MRDRTLLNAVDRRLASTGPRNNIARTSSTGREGAYRGRTAEAAARGRSRSAGIVQPARQTPAFSRAQSTLLRRQNQAARRAGTPRNRNRQGD